MDSQSAINRYSFPSVARYFFPGNTTCESLKRHNLDDCFLFYFILCGIIGTTICLVGIMCNIVSLLLICKLEKQSITLFLLKSLAIADSIYLLVYLANWSFTSWLNYFGFVGLSLRIYDLRTDLCDISSVQRFFNHIVMDDVSTHLTQVCLFLPRFLFNSCAYWKQVLCIKMDI